MPTLGSGIKQANHTYFTSCVNTSSTADIAAAVEQTHAALGQVAILVNNAALSPFCKFEDLSDEAWDSLMAINLKCPFLCTKAVIEELKAAGWGRTFNIGTSAPDRRRQHGPLRGLQGRGDRFH